MSDSRNTDNMRKLHRASKIAANKLQRGNNTDAILKDLIAQESNEIMHELGLFKNPSRHGNKRHMEAEKKVKERRASRHSDNQMLRNQVARWQFGDDQDGDEE